MVWFIVPQVYTRLPIIVTTWGMFHVFCHRSRWRWWLHSPLKDPEFPLCLVNRETAYTNVPPCSPCCHTTLGQGQYWPDPGLTQESPNYFPSLKVLAIMGPSVFERPPPLASLKTGTIPSKHLSPRRIWESELLASAQNLSLIFKLIRANSPCLS